MGDHLEVKCSRCEVTLHHECHPKTLEEAALDLFMWRPESGFPKALKKGNDMCDGAEDDEGVPFITESFLYPLVGKEDARTFMALVNNVFRALGVEPRDFATKAWELLDKKKRDRAAEQVRRAEARKRYRKEMQPVMRSERPNGYFVCKYRSFYCFDTNVGACESGGCFERDDGESRTLGSYKKAKLGKVVTDADGVLVACGLCKRIHLATPAQLEGWRKEPRYPSRTEKEAKDTGLRVSKPEHWIRSRVIFTAFGFKDEKPEE
jgi:hypothetical protein